ncbi:DUF4349 domain-containing protein [Acinetobacter sp. NIPH 298]|uniref:DUF4349 domain-containing protein n=1 Tax=Acinetobacter sp. NIPH 298 TaxID=1217692 RepID=UPI0002CFE4E5|nr:DUF4349 domain-containing protein [Acinetobacter sp. NIPH 298]ENW97659.1 hypothetical protein F903_00175 [Acinetobacter sp. NIPH 298]
MSDLAKKLTIVLILSTAIVGCSKKEEGMASDPSVAAERTASNSDIVQENTVKNPEQLVGTQQSALEQNRQLVKSAQLQFEVKDVLQTTSALEQQLLQYNGYIENKQIDYQVSDRSQRNRIDGTIDIYEKIIPFVQLTVRIPNDQVTTFLNTLLPLMLNFNTQSYEAKPYELKLLEEKLNTANQSNSASNTVNNQLQQLTDLEVKDRLAYSTIRLEFFQQPKVRKSHDLNIHRIATMDSEPLLTRIGEAFKVGLSYFKETILWLIQFWAFFLVIIAIWVIRKAYRLRKQGS